jgi:hypothetical protein
MVVNMINPPTEAVMPPTPRRLHNLLHHLGLIHHVTLRGFPALDSLRRFGSAALRQVCGRSFLVIAASIASRSI